MTYYSELLVSASMSHVWLQTLPSRHVLPIRRVLGQRRRHGLRRVQLYLVSVADLPLAETPAHDGVRRDAVHVVREASPLDERHALFRCEEVVVATCGYLLPVQF